MIKYECNAKDCPLKNGKRKRIGYKCVESNCKHLTKVEPSIIERLIKLWKFITPEEQEELQDIVSEKETKYYNEMHRM